MSCTKETTKSKLIEALAEELDLPTTTALSIVNTIDVTIIAQI